MADTITPLRQLGVWEVKINNVSKKEVSSFKGKEYPASYVITLEDSRGRMIDDKFKLPLTDEKNKYDKKRLEGLMKLLGVKTISELKGKTVAALVEPFEWETKVLWNPKKYFDVKYLLDPSASLGEDLFAPDATGSLDEIPF